MNWQWCCSDWTCVRFSFCPLWDLNWRYLDFNPVFYTIRLDLRPLDLRSCTLPLYLSDFTFSSLTISVILLWGRGIGHGIFMTGTVREFHFAYIRIWTGDLWISNPALYKCVTVTSGFDLWQFQVFNTGAEALLVLMFWLDYLREVQLAHNGIWTWDLWISSPVVKHYAAVSSGFHLWKFHVFNCGAEEFVVVLF